MESSWPGGNAWCASSRSAALRGHQSARCRAGDVPGQPRQRSCLPGRRRLGIVRRRGAAGGDRRASSRVVVSTLTAQWLRVDRGRRSAPASIGYNGVLVGLALGTFLAPGPLLWVYVVLGAAVSVVVTLGHRQRGQEGGAWRRSPGPSCSSRGCCSSRPTDSRGSPARRCRYGGEVVAPFESMAATRLQLPVLSSRACS